MPTNSSKQVVKKTSGKMGKLLGAANMILSVIPDTVEIVGKITDKTAPNVDKHLDRQHQLKQSLVVIPNLLDVDIQQAKEHLEGLGLQVIGQAVEDPQAAAALWMGGIDFIQGNLVQRPEHALDFDFQHATL